MTLGKLIVPKKRKDTPTIAIESTTATKKAKKKEATPSYFRFKIESLQIDVFPPNFLEEQSSSKTFKKVPGETGRMSFNFDLTDYIIKGSDRLSDDSSTYSSSSVSTYDPSTPSSNSTTTQSTVPTPNTLGSDDHLSPIFTLSTFRKAVMIAALNGFCNSYKSKISAASKIYSNIVFNQKIWTELKSTEELHQLIVKEHRNKNRITDKSLRLRVSLGTSTKEAFRDSLDEYFQSEDVLAFSQNQELALSPEPKMSVSSLRRNMYNRNKQLEQLMERMFYHKESPIYHGFLCEHKSSFTVLLGIVIQSGTKNGNEAFFDSLESNSKVLNKDECDKFMIKPYLNNGNFSGTQGLHPEKDKFPPKNRNEKFPQSYRDWKSTKTNGSNTLSNIGDNGNAVGDISSMSDMMKMYIQAKAQAAIGSIMPADGMLDNNIQITTNGNRVITIRCDDDITSTDSIPIDEIELKGTSTMREVLTFQDDGYPSFSDDNNLDIDNFKWNSI